MTIMRDEEKTVSQTMLLVNGNISVGAMIIT